MNKVLAEIEVPSNAGEARRANGPDEPLITRHAAESSLSGRGFNLFVSKNKALDHWQKITRGEAGFCSLSVEGETGDEAYEG